MDSYTSVLCRYVAWENESSVKLTRHATMKPNDGGDDDDDDR